MAKKVYEESHIAKIGRKIRELTKTDTTYKTSTMASGVSSVYDKGYETGHTQGYTEGKTAGYNEGHSAGYGEGYETGHNEGYSHGHSDGWAAGLMRYDPMMKYYSGETNELEIPVSITKIRASAFRQHAAMTSISGLNNVIMIDGYAFADCKALTEVSLPSVNNLASRAFYGCTALASVYIPKVTRIQNQAFYNCTSLTSITFKSTPTSIESTAFQGCTNLVTINVPWAEGAVANAPWGATNATINYNYTGG